MKKIIFIEDEAALQEAMGEALRQNGYKVIKALNGEIGLRLIKSEKPDLILLDLMIPSKNGFEVLKEIKENEETQKIPVIVLTNLEGIKDLEKALSLGATTYLVKANYDLEELVQKIEKTLND